MTDLERAVHALTRETRTKVIQDGDGNTQSVAIVIHAPLLTQLAEAVTSSLGSGGGGGGGKAEKNVLDSEALYQSARIRAFIGDWLKVAGLVPTRDLIKDLEAWAKTVRDDPAFYIRHLDEWAAWIERKLDPPRRMEVTSDCPTCGKGVYTDEEGNTLKFPILIEYREGEMDIALGECRACEKTWKGERELRQLRWDLDTAG